jgi:hypothetical protein
MTPIVAAATRRRGSALAVALMSILAPCLAAAQELPAWLPGCWSGQDGSAAAGATEIWTAPQAGRMLGLGITVRGNRSSFEFLHIERTEQGFDYVAQPGGRPPVRFASAGVSAGRVEFANPQHDFPQRIEYARDGDTLRAELSTTDRARKQTFVFKRVSCDTFTEATEPSKK